ncbi:hypothetical protein N7492_001876 [Penicillium capsulatum]|uniref:Uncharacterized protein n=1 Tax=Penicillium capsulatum TaxID=69766 RepID=A0A9W9IWN7_9EURO|nr:hypothetical protein N7492_001876 [Penicillium capsulatum]
MEEFTIMQQGSGSETRESRKGVANGVPGEKEDGAHNYGVPVCDLASLGLHPGFPTRQDPILFPHPLGPGRVAPRGKPPSHPSPRMNARDHLDVSCPSKRHRNALVAREMMEMRFGYRRLCAVGNMPAAGRPIAAELGGTHTSSIQGHSG